MEFVCEKGFVEGRVLIRLSAFGGMLAFCIVIQTSPVVL